jgi:hypothetical protein
MTVRHALAGLRRFIMVGVSAALLAGPAGANEALNASLRAAAKAGDRAKVEALIDQGADVNARDKDSRTPLHDVFFSNNGTIDLAGLLIGHGADVNAHDVDGRTPLHLVISGGSLQWVEFLVARGADLHAIDNNGKTARDYAQSAGQRDIAAFLTERTAAANADGLGIADPPLCQAAEDGDLARVKVLLGEGADVNGKNAMDWTPFDCAVRSIDTDMERQRPAAPQMTTIIRLLIAGGGISGSEYGWNSIAGYPAAVIKVVIECLPDGKLEIAAGSRAVYDLLVYAGTPGLEPSLSRTIISKFSMAARLKTLHELTSVLGRTGFVDSSPREAIHVASAEHRFYGPYAGSTLRRSAILLAQRVTPSPTVSTAARQALEDGNVTFKNAQDDDGYVAAERSFKLAVGLAPWWADAYYNLALVQELLGLPGEARMNLEYYLLNAPGAADSSEIRARIQELASAN